MADFQDQTLTCKDCGSQFVWTKGEQEFYAAKGFENAPTRCPACRNARKEQDRGARVMHDAVCANCGGVAQVPFVPRGDKPVYCSNCYKQMRTQQG